MMGMEMIRWRWLLLDGIRTIEKIFGNYLAGSGFGPAKVAKFHSRIDGSG